MIIILFLSLAFACYLCFRIGIREGRYRATEEMRESYSIQPMQTRDFLIGKTDELPMIFDRIL